MDFNTPEGIHVGNKSVNFLMRSIVFPGKDCEKKHEKRGEYTARPIGKRSKRKGNVEIEKVVHKYQSIFIISSVRVSSSQASRQHEWMIRYD